MQGIKWYYYVILLAAGMIWGATIPGIKVVMSNGMPISGALLWQAVLVCFVSAVLCLIQRVKIQINWVRLRLCIWMAACGTLLPSLIGFWVVQHLPAGIYAITIALVPIYVMPIALLLGNERFEWVRIIGVIFGAASIALLIGPETSLPDPAKVIFVLIALIAPLFYALEDNYIAYFGRDNMNPSAVLCVAMGIASLVMVVITLARGELFLLGQQGWGRSELALVFVSVFNALAYITFIWLIGKAGPVFSSFVAYLVTGFGVIWSILFLGEQYSAWVWVALGLMFVAMFLVQPRNQH